MNNNKLKVEFILFDTNVILTNYQIEQKNKLLQENIIKIFDNFTNIENNKNQHSIFFNTEYTNNFYDFEELTKLVKIIKKQIEIYLNKKIEVYISFQIQDSNSDSEEKLNMARILKNITNINYII